MRQTLAGRLRSRIFSPDPAEAMFERRGFTASSATQQANLEKVGTKFLEGFDYGLTGRGLVDIEAALEGVETPFRGFAYEGCAMGLAVRDALLPARQHWVRDFIVGPGAPHTYMAHIGVGWAMARLPVMRWRSVMPQDPMLRWLVLDGYGFHQAYFKTKQYVTGQFQTRLPVWQPSGYANRVVDQGIGRALWFVNGSDVRGVAGAIGRFAQERHADLWSGTGLASTYAGGVEEADLELMRSLAGEYVSYGAQGAAFAAKARLLAGLATPHTEMAAQVWCGMPAAKAAALTDDAIEVLQEPEGDVPGFERWRQRIRQNFQ
jgi:hypothetical protein